MRALFRIAFILLTLVVASLALSGKAHARGSDGFRCPDTDRVISLGMSMGEVSLACRQPDGASSHQETITESRERWVGRERFVATAQRTIQHDDWTFDFGHSRFVRYLCFVDGRLQSVSEGGYGTDR